MEITFMKDSSPLFSTIQRPFDIRATRKRSGPGKVVMISSHPGWPARREHADDGGEGEIAADTVHLTRVFHEVLERVRQGPVLNMDDESVTVGQMIDQIWRQLVEDVPLRLSQILRMTRTERSVICLQLALLELVRLQAIRLLKGPHLSDILLQKSSALPGS